jgi:hypothetical protein
VVTTGHITLAAGRVYVLVLSEHPGSAIETKVERGGFTYTAAGSDYELVFHDSGRLDVTLHGTIGAGVLRLTREGAELVFDRMH